MNIRHSTRNILASLGFVLAATGALAADDPKAYPGTTCHWVEDGTYRVYQGTVMNDATSGERMQVMCPLVKDGSAISSATIDVYDRNSNTDGNVTCTLYAETVTPTGVFYDNQSESTSSWSITTEFTLVFDALSGQYYYARCWIPPKFNGYASHVARIRIVEN